MYFMPISSWHCVIAVMLLLLLHSQIHASIVHNLHVQNFFCLALQLKKTRKIIINRIQCMETIIKMRLYTEFSHHSAFEISIIYFGSPKLQYVLLILHIDTHALGVTMFVCMCHYFIRFFFLCSLQ